MAIESTDLSLWTYFQNASDTKTSENTTCIAVRHFINVVLSLFGLCPIKFKTESEYFIGFLTMTPNMFEKDMLKMPGNTQGVALCIEIS